jgi:hypothetical protein
MLSRVIGRRAMGDPNILDLKRRGFDGHHDINPIIGLPRSHCTSSFSSPTAGLIDNDEEATCSADGWGQTCWPTCFAG